MRRAPNRSTVTPINSVDDRHAANLLRGFSISLAEVLASWRETPPELA